jgi:hypothetical protein
MGEVGNCYENALAERMNGILKYETAVSYCRIKGIQDFLQLRAISLIESSMLFLQTKYPVVA